MTALIIIGVILLIIVMILLLPVHVTAAVKDEAKVFLRILFVRIKLFPMKEKPKKKKKEQKPKQEKPKEKTEKKEKEKRDIPSLVRSVADILGVFLRQFSKHVIGTDDAAKTALLYGAAEQATAYLFTILGENAKFTFSKKNSLVWADFTSDRTMADVKIDVSISVFGTLAMLVPTYIAYVRNFGAIKPTEIKPQTEDALGKEE